MRAGRDGIANQALHNAHVAECCPTRRSLFRPDLQRLEEIDFGIGAGGSVRPFHVQRQSFQAADEVRFDQCGLAVELDRTDSWEQFGENGSDLHAGQFCAQTIMRAEPESQMWVGVAADVETKRIFEHLFVAIA